DLFRLNDNFNRAGDFAAPGSLAARRRRRAQAHRQLFQPTLDPIILGQQRERLFILILGLGIFAIIVELLSLLLLIVALGQLETALGALIIGIEGNHLFIFIERVFVSARFQLIIGKKEQPEQIERLQAGLGLLVLGVQFQHAFKSLPRRLF